jgi:hypothetical protein
MRLPRGEVNSRPVGGAGEAGAGARGGARGVRAVPREVGPVQGVVGLHKMLIMMPAVVKEGLLCPPGANNEDVPVFIKFPSDPVVLVVGDVTKLDTSPGFTGCLSNPGVASAGSPSCRTGNRATSVG